MAEPRLIVFDMDGTLIDSGAIIAAMCSAIPRPSRAGADT